MSKSSRPSPDELDKLDELIDKEFQLKSSYNRILFTLSGYEDELATLSREENNDSQPERKAQLGSFISDLQIELLTSNLEKQLAKATEELTTYKREHDLKVSSSPFIPPRRS